LSCNIFAAALRCCILAEKLYLGRPFSRIGTPPWVVFQPTDACGFAAPRMEQLRQTSYFRTDAEQKEKARPFVRRLAWVSQLANVMNYRGIAGSLAAE